MAYFFFQFVHSQTSKSIHFIRMLYMRIFRESLIACQYRLSSLLFPGDENISMTFSCSNFLDNLLKLSILLKLIRQTDRPVDISATFINKTKNTNVEHLLLKKVTFLVSIAFFLY